MLIRQATTGIPGSVPNLLGNASIITKLLLDTHCDNDNDGDDDDYDGCVQLRQW
jgi:hypothetical protein